MRRLLLFVPALLSAQQLYQDPDGFQLQLPAGWQVNKFGQGGVVARSASGDRFAMVLPLLGVAGDCASSLRGSLDGKWNAFPQVGNLQIRPAAKGSASAHFTFRQGQSRGVLLCAPTGPRSGMFYGIAAPAAQYAATRAQLVSVVRSFRYGGAAQAPTQQLPMEPWREPTESAYQSVKPAGWRVNGGVRRLSNADVRVGVQLVSTGNDAAIWLGDVRLNKCFVPGTYSSQYNSAPLGAGAERCPYRDGTQMAEFYAQRILASDWTLSNTQIVARRARPDLVPFTAAAAGVRASWGEIRFAATRNGVPVEGVIIGNTNFSSSGSVDPNGGLYTSYVTGYVGPQTRSAELSSYAARVMAGVRYNYSWVTGNRQAAQNDHRMEMEYNRQIAELGKQMFDERSASAQRRSDAVGHLLSGTVPLKDNEGNRYQAKAGSNYYYLNAPNQTIEGRNVWESIVDLKPLEVID